MGKYIKYNEQTDDKALKEAALIIKKWGAGVISDGNSLWYWSRWFK